MNLTKNDIEVLNKYGADISTDDEIFQLKVKFSSDECYPDVKSVPSIRVDNKISCMENEIRDKSTGFNRQTDSKIGVLAVCRLMDLPDNIQDTIKITSYNEKISINRVEVNSLITSDNCFVIYQADFPNSIIGFVSTNIFLNFFEYDFSLHVEMESAYVMPDFRGQSLGGIISRISGYLICKAVLNIFNDDDFKAANDIELINFTFEAQMMHKHTEILLESLVSGFSKSYSDNNYKLNSYPDYDANLTD